jgi:tripartite-type tricarboxylate transporter receptor subunit TctC
MAMGRIGVLSSLAMLFFAVPGSVFADNLFSKPVRLIVPFDPGGFPDRVARILAKGLSEDLNQSFYVQNKPGGGGLLGTAEAAQAAPDGQTLLMSSLGSQVLAPLTTRSHRFDPIADFTHIAFIGGPADAFVTASSAKIHLFDDLLKRARSESITYGTGGVGSLGHFAAEYVAEKAGLRLIHVPYNGPAGLVSDLISGVIDLGSISISTALPLVEAGKMQVLAIASDERVSQQPTVPTLRELGIDFSATNWLAISAPAHLPAPYVRRLNAEVAAILARPESRDLLRNEMIAPKPMSPDELDAFIEQELARWRSMEESKR